jgi:hypothetical protein
VVLTQRHPFVCVGVPAKENWAAWRHTHRHRLLLLIAKHSLLSGCKRQTDGSSDFPNAASRGRQLRQDKRGAIPNELAPILDRLHVTGEGWLRLVEHFSRLVRRAAGRPTFLSRDAAKWGRRRRPGIAASRAFFV